MANFQLNLFVYKNFGTTGEHVCDFAKILMKFQ